MDKRVKRVRLSRMRRWRRQQGWTLAEVAGLTGLSIAMLSLVERRRRNLAPVMRVQVARRLGVPLTALFEVEDLAVDG